MMSFETTTHFFFLVEKKRKKSEIFWKNIRFIAKKNPKWLILLNFGFFSDIFSLVRHKIFWQNLRYFWPLKSHVGQTAGIFRRYLRYFSMFFAAERYIGDISDIQELQATFGCFKTSKNIGEVCRTLAFWEKIRNFRHFPRKKKYQILKNQKVRGCSKRHHDYLWACFEKDKRRLWWLSAVEISNIEKFFWIAENLAMAIRFAYALWVSDARMRWKSRRQSLPEFWF